MSSSTSPPDAPLSAQSHTDGFFTDQGLFDRASGLIRHPFSGMSEKERAESDLLVAEATRARDIRAEEERRAGGPASPGLFGIFKTEPAESHPRIVEELHAAEEPHASVEEHHTSEQPLPNSLTHSPFFGMSKTELAELDRRIDERIRLRDIRAAEKRRAGGPTSPGLFGISETEATKSHRRIDEEPRTTRGPIRRGLFGIFKTEETAESHRCIAEEVRAAEERCAINKEYLAAEERRALEKRRAETEGQRWASAPHNLYFAQSEDDNMWAKDAHYRGDLSSHGLTPWRRDRVKERWILQGIWRDEWNDDGTPGLRWKHEDPYESESDSEDDPDAPPPPSPPLFGTPRPPRRPKCAEERKRIAERAREASRPLHQFISQVSLECERILQEADWAEVRGRRFADASDVFDRDMHSRACENVKDKWIKWGIWNLNWKVLPGMAWNHERPLDELLADGSMVLWDGTCYLRPQGW